MREHGKSARKRAWRTVRTESSVGYIVAVAEDETRSVRSPELTAGDVDDAMVGNGEFVVVVVEKEQNEFAAVGDDEFV